MKIIKTIMLVTAVGMGILTVGGCQTEAQNDALIGGAVGAGAGQLIGGDTKATVIGGAIGAGAGYLWGNAQDKKKEKEQAQVQTLPSNADANAVTVWITNSNGSKTPIKLARNTDGSYTGPKGEIYTAMPTEEQLKNAYGF